MVPVLSEAVDLRTVRRLAYCAIRDHSHLVVRRMAVGDLSRFLRWLTLAEMPRWHAHRQSVCLGPTECA